MTMAHSGDVARSALSSRPQLTRPTQRDCQQSSSAHGDAWIAPADARAIAKDAYIYGFPMVKSYGLQYAYFVDRCSPEFKGTWNEIVHEMPICTPQDSPHPDPVPEIAHSYLGADLRAEPLVLTMPAVDRRRYHSAQLIDMYTFNFAYLGGRTTGHTGGRFLL